MNKNGLYFISLITLLMIVSLACGSSAKVNMVEATTPVKESKDEIFEPSELIQTVKGDFTIPGIAYMDGIDEEALDGPLTVMNINIWDNAPRNEAVCSLRHGDEVQILESRFLDSENRYYFKISNGICIGWVSEPFVSPTFREAKGDLF